MSKHGRVAFGSALGAFCGGVVSLEIAARYQRSPLVALIGLAIGAIIGYLAYDFAAVCRAVRQVAIAMWRGLPSALSWIAASVTMCVAFTGNLVLAIIFLNWLSGSTITDIVTFVVHIPIVSAVVVLSMTFMMVATLFNDGPWGVK
jgi:ABC-type microcin C transport system permease subunit YejE